MFKAIVLGCGLVGETMARDLATDSDFSVTAADIDTRHLERLAEHASVETVQADLSTPDAVRRLVEPFDIVLGALPSRFGHATLGAMIEAGKPYCDISFMPEDALSHDQAAKQRGVTAVVDCGVSPGLSNLLVAYAAAQLDECTRAVIYVGGLPVARQWPWQYKAPFAPSDVLEEYTRPARMVEHGKIVTKEPLTEPVLIDFPEVGTLEALNTDGLRSLLTTMDIPNMKEQTLRYPGHGELMRVMRHAGLFGLEPIQVGDTQVRPIDVTSTLLFGQWAFAEVGEDEFTVLRVIAEGRKSGEDVRYTFDLCDEYDHNKGMSSMARTTAFPNVIAAGMLARGEIKATGVLPPELLIHEPGVYEKMCAELAKRDVHIETKEERLPAT